WSSGLLALGLEGEGVPDAASSTVRFVCREAFYEPRPVAVGLRVAEPAGTAPEYRAAKLNLRARVGIEIEGPGGGSRLPEVLAADDESGAVADVGERCRPRAAALAPGGR